MVSETADMPHQFVLEHLVHFIFQVYSTLADVELGKR